MLVPKVPAKEFVKYGFKKCKGAKDCECYYLCVARDCKVIFVTDAWIDVRIWESDNPLIHKQPKCLYKDMRVALDIIYELLGKDLKNEKR